ncbi:uncharacterized protein LOC111003404 isoform X2 [Pieris rapae]|uniref:uncharacterized protein LOC111003404 isoform X2 n=1 Tax=Pieris rapae TaxID=64459 RepID=UPI001E27AA0F|nr:uncharacterized protein LOC111003404 isoform X2 [Pieris rapae]
MGSNCCKGDAAGNPLVRSNSSVYTRNRAGATLDHRFRTSVDASGVRLTVSSAQIGDSGVYTLQASNAAGKDTTRVSLEVSPDETPTGDDPPAFLRRLQDLTVKVGTRTRFLVEILSSTECRVTWYRNERRLLEAERIALVRDGNFWCADVATVSVDDAGRWTCTAENLGGRASCSAHLNVLVPKAYKRPEFVEELRAILTEQGTVSLECKVVGVPTPVLRWFKDSREIKAGDVFALTANADDPTSLGTYTCEAINCMGRAYSSSKVHVIGRSKEGSDKPGGLTSDPPPIFTKELEDQFVRICDHLSLRCQIVVPPWPRSVVWYNKQGKVDPSTRYHIIEDGVGGYMIEVSASEWADEGEWKCVATSAGGRVGISTCSVTMDVPKNYRKPRFMENLQAVLTEEGLVSFECKVVGFPTPILSWFKDGQELKPGDVYQLTGTNSLGSYCCIARNCMGQASSSAELTVEDIQNQLNEEEKLQLFSKNQAPKFLQGLKSVEVKIDEPFRFTIKVVIPPEPTVLWYRDDQPMDESPRCHLGKEDRGVFYLDIKNLELMDQTEWKCVAMNDYGHSVTSCFLKLIIPRHYKKPRFLENLQAILSDEGAVNLECKVIGVPQPVLKWYKDGEELKPGDIHRIISGQDGTCCLGTYTCEAQNCMGIAASSASLLGFEDTVKAKKKRADDQILQRNLSLSTIHEERTSQMYDTPVADVTLDEKGEISFSFDGKEVSVSLYETPDLTEEEALQIVEMYADQLSENVTEHNVIELPPLRFVKETSTSGNLLMEAIIIDVSPDYFVPPEEDLRTEADIEDISIAEENGQQQLSFDQDVADEYIDKTMALLCDEKSDIVLKPVRRKSDSQKSGEDYFSLSRDQSLSEEKKDDDTQILSESITFASAHSTGKQKSKPSQEDDVGTQESSDITKTVLLREELRTCIDIENKTTILTSSAKRDSLQSKTSFKKGEVDITDLNENMIFISLSLSNILNKVQMLKRDIILQSESMPTAEIASKSLEMINSIIDPLTEIQSITDAFKESKNDDAKPKLLTKLPQCLKYLLNSLAMVEKCVDVGSDKTLINNTCISIINNCQEDITTFVEKIRQIPDKYSPLIDEMVSTEIKLFANDILNIIAISKTTVTTKSNLSHEIHKEELSIDKQHLNNTQKAIYHLKVPLNSLLGIIENALKKSLLSYNETNNAEAILFNMSSSIQDLQTALEQIEFLSVEESNSSLPKYNTTTIETVISSVLKLRNSFESLSFEKEKKYDKDQLGSVLQVIKVDLEDISFRINDIENTIGSFDVLYGDNKLEILQRMAHVLIALENSLPVLSSLPNVQTTVSTFHKNLTKALENAIESNESDKYSALLHICDVVSRINVSIKGFESSKFISLTSILNNFNIIEENLKCLSIDQGIREDILKSVYQCYIDIQNVKMSTYAEDLSIKMNSERGEDISTDQFYTESKANLVVQQIDQVIATINNISPEEVTPSLCSILPILQNTCPVLEELKFCVASLEENIQDNSHASDIISLAQSIGNPLQSIQENITVLNQVLLETVGETKSKDDAIGVFAKPLYELYTTLQALQENVFSEYESFSLNENSIKIATSSEVLQKCILIVEEQCYIEGLDEMSTLQDISCLKTIADPTSEGDLISPVIQETLSEAPNMYTLESQPEIANEFQLLHDDILEIQKLDILEALNTLSEVKEYAHLKSVTETIEEIQHKIVSILSPLVMESLSSVSNLDLASNNLKNISESLFKLKNHLTVIDVDNIPIYEDVLKIPSNKIHSIVKNISNLKEHLEKCLLSVQRHTNFLGSDPIKDLYYVCNEFVSISKTTVLTCASKNENMYNLVRAVENFLQVMKTTPDLNAEEVKSVFSDLYISIMNMEDTLFEYVCPKEITVTKENPMETRIHKMASHIAALEHYNPDLFIASNTDFPQSVSLTCIESEYLSNMESVIVNTAIIMQNLTNQSYKTESQEKESVLIQNFMENIKNSFTIIRVLLTQQPSHKKVIRLFQEYFTVQVNINKFKNEKSIHTHPENLMYLEEILNQAEGNLEKIKLYLIKFSSSISKALFREPLTKINYSMSYFPNYLRLDSIMDVHDLIQNFLIIVNIAAPHLENLEQNVGQELETCIFINSDAENKLITDSLDNFLSLLEREMCDNPDKEKEKLLKELIRCFKNHQDYKNAVGTGKRMIILKCLADCSDILRNHFRVYDTEINLLESTNGGTLQNSLTKLIQQLKSLNLKINEVQGNVCMYPKHVVSDLKIKNIVSLKECCEKFLNDVSQYSLCEDDICLINDIIHEIHSIQDNINTLQNDLDIFEDLKDIENFFQKTLASDEVTKVHKLSKADTKSILQHVEQYIEVTEIIEEISAIINLGNVKKTKEIAQELRESLAPDNAQSMDASEELKYCTISENQESLAKRLQISLSNIQENELLSCDTHVRKHILDVISKLQDDLNTIACTEKFAGCASMNKTSQDPGTETNEKSCHDIGLLSISNYQECTTQDMSINKHHEKTNAVAVIHQIEDTISCISGIILEEISIDVKNIYPVFENICPILEELKLNVATLQENIDITESPISDISDSPVQKAFSKPLHELEENISVLTHLILESLKGTKENENVHMLGVLAKPLHELHITYQILQENVISQYESLSLLPPNINFAATEQILNSCVLLVQEPYEVEIADEMSTLEDISCIKTTADSISSDALGVAQDMQVTAEEYYTSHKHESELDELATQQAQTQSIMNENRYVSIEEPLKLEHAISQETIVSNDKDNNKTKVTTMTENDVVKENRVLTKELIRQDDEHDQAAAQDIQIAQEKCNETGKTNISSSYDDQLKSERAIEQDTNDDNIKKTETNLTEKLKECVEPKKGSDQKIKIPAQECLEKTKENISEPIDQPFVPEQVAEKGIETNKTNISSSYDDQFKSERAIEHDTIDEDIKKIEVNPTEIIEELVITKKDTDQKIQVPTHECLEKPEESICIPSDQPFKLEQAAVQIDLEKCIETSKTNISSSYDDQIKSERAIEQDSIDEDNSKSATKLTEIIQEFVEPKNDSDQKIQVPVQECLENTEESKFVPIDQPFVPEVAAAQETKNTLEKGIETSKTNISSSYEDQFKSERAIEHDTIDEDIKKIEVNSTEIIEEFSVPKKDSDQKIQVPTQECLEKPEENICVPSDQPFVHQKTAEQDTQITLEKGIETSETNIYSSYDDQFKSGRATEHDTINEDFKKIEKISTEEIEQCVIAKIDSDQKIQVPTQENLAKTEENICVLIDQPFVLEQAAVQVTLEKCIETTKTNISSSYDNKLKSEQVTEQDTIDKGIKKMETYSTELLEECVEPKKDSDQKMQIPMQECLEKTEENICVLNDQPFVFEQAAAQDTKIMLEKGIETKNTNISSSYDDQLKSERAIEQDTNDDNIKKTETNLIEKNKECVKRKKDSDQKIKIPTQECLEKTKENISESIDQPFVPEQAAAQEIKITPEKGIETSKTNISSSYDDQLKSERAIEQDTNDDNIKKTETNLIEKNKECVKRKKDSDQKIKIPTQECLEKTKENISESIDQPFVPEQAAAQEIKITPEKGIETSKTNISSSYDDQFKSERAIEHDTIDEDIKKIEVISTEIIEELVITKKDTDHKIQVPTQECLEKPEENIRELNDQSKKEMAKIIQIPINKSIEQDNTHEIVPTLKKCEETTEKNISSPFTPELVQELRLTVEENMKTHEKHILAKNPIPQQSHTASEDCKDLITNVENIMYQKCTDTNYNLKYSKIIQTMNSLVNELHEILISGSSSNVEKTYSLQNILDEFQVQIIKLKSVNIKDVSNTLNETIEDLECSVRSVQLLINESSPTDHVIEASATIELLVNSIKEHLSTIHFQDTMLGKPDLLEECVGDTEVTLLLLEKVSETTTNHDDILKIINDLNTVKDSIKTIKLSFSIDEETVIENGIEILQSLDTIEHQLFTIENVLEKMPTVESLTRDTIINAVHSVYTNISNIRGTISNIKKSYIYQNYGKPSENLLKAIKNINHIKSIDNNHNWISVTKHFRNILNHFEEIKFYINLDKTARQPSDASITKVVLNELKLLLSNVVLTNVKKFQSLLENSVDTVIKYIEQCIQTIDSTPVLEVREKIPIYKELTGRLIDFSNEILERYKHVNTLNIDPNANEPQSNEIFTSVSQYESDKTIVLESPKDDCMEVTVVQAGSALNDLVSQIITESSYFKDDTLPENTDDTETQTVKNNVEKQFIEGVQSIIEHLIEEAIIKVTLLRIQNGKDQDIENEDYLQMSQEPHDNTTKTLLDAITIELKSKEDSFQSMADIDKRQKVSEDSQIDQQIKNILNCEEESLLLDLNIKPQTESDRLAQDRSDKNVKIGLGNVEKKTLLTDRSKEDFCINNKLGNEISDEYIKKESISQNIELKYLDETIVNKNEQEITCSDILNVTLDSNEGTKDLKKDDNIKTIQQHKETFDGNCKNIQEKSLILESSENSKNHTLLQSDPLIRESLLEIHSTAILDSEMKSIAEEELCTMPNDDKNVELISETVNSSNDMKAKRTTTIIDKVSINKHKMNDLDISCTEVGENNSSLPDVLEEKLEIIQNMKSEIESKENHNTTETTRASAEISREEIEISNVEIKKVDKTTEENNKIIGNESLQDNNISQVQLNKDDVQSEIEVSTSLINQSHFDFDQNLIIEEGRRNIRKNEDLIEANTKNTNEQQKLGNLNLNFAKGEQDAASEQNIVDIQTDFENVILSSNLSDSIDSNVFQDQNTLNEQLIDIVDDNTSFSSGDKQENVLGINIISQNDKHNLLSPEEIIICPSIQGSSAEENIFDRLEVKENVSNLVPEQNQQNKGFCKREEDTDQHATYTELIDANTALANTNPSAKSNTTIENRSERESNLDREEENNVNKEESICHILQSEETIESSSSRINTLCDTRDEISTVEKKINESKSKTNRLSKKRKTKEDNVDNGKSNDIDEYERAKFVDDVARQKNQDTDTETVVASTLSTFNVEIPDNKKVKSEMNQTQINDKNTEDETTNLTDVKTKPCTVKEKPQFVDPNLVDISMGLLRPPTYISKPFQAENFLTPELNTYTSTAKVFYKAQSLIRDHQSKLMYTGDREKQMETQQGTKATSESRSIYSEKRASSIRDLRRKPVFTTHLTNRTAVEGSRVKLTCSVLSSTEPVLKWYKNGVLLEDKHKYRVKFIDGLITMELLNALPSDSGDYSCTVDNEHGSITTSAKLKVYPSFEASPIPPTFTRSIRDVYHRAENELILECRIRGQPLPTISWFKDNNPIATDDRYEASYLADGLCRLTINSPNQKDSGTYTCKAESAVWSDQITHVVNFDDASRLDSHISSVEKLRLTHDARRPHFTNVLSDYKVIKGGTIGLQVEIGGAPTRVEWLREGSSVTELDQNAQTFVDHGIYTLALNDVSERHSGLYTCRAWSMHGNVDMNAEISVVQPNEVDGKPAVIVSRPTKDILISVGEDINISFRVQGEPKPKVFFLKGIRDITNSQRVCKMTSDDYVKFTMKRSVITDAGTYCIMARNVYGCDRAFVTVEVRQRASSDNLISDWTYPTEDTTIISTERKYKSVPGRIPGEPSAVDGGNNWVALSWPKSDPQEAAPVLAYRIDSWLLGKEGGARWIEMGITPRNTFDAFNLKQGEEYHFRVTPRNRYGWGEPVQTSSPIAVGIAGDRPEFIDILPGLLKVLVGETATLSCSFKGKPTPVIVWMKNGREIEESGKFMCRQNGNMCSLTIKDVEIEDEGRYSCEATNAHGRASTYARMTVITDRQIWEADAKLKRERSADATGEFPPQFTMRLRDRRVQATYPVRLTFQVIGSPTPNVTWFKDGQEITFDSRKTSYKDEHFHTLEIAPTTLDDGGLYEALARNNSGAVSCRCSLVVDKGIRAYVAPEFCCGLEPLYRLNEGDELRISAIVEAYPSVGVTWYRDGVRLRPSRRAIMTLDRDGQIELALASVTPRDAGVYTCTASNEVGQASTSGKVEIITDQREERRNVPTVICPDIPYSKEPMFIIKPRSTEAQEGDTVIIECEVIGDPTPEVYWLRDFLKPDYYRDAKHFKQMAAGPLYRFEIPHAKLDFTGAYSVVARNVHGEAKAIISLQIFAKDLSSSDETHNIRYGRVEVIPRFEKELTDLLCYDSDAIEFECLISGHPEPDIRWFHYNQLLPDCPDFESTYDLGIARLKIKQVAAEDEGTYTCEASNNLGKATSTACLVVYPPGEPNTISQQLQRPPALASAASTPRSTPRVTPARSVSRTPARSAGPDRRLRSPTREVGPKFYTYPFNKVVEEGDSVVLQCAVGGFPTPWATWDKDGIVITPTSRISVKEKDEMLRILQIDEVNVDDVGLYRITLENDFGRAEASARLEVISNKGKFHSRSSSVSPARLYRRRTPSFTRQD